MLFWKNLFSLYILLFFTLIFLQHTHLLKILLILEAFSIFMITLISTNAICLTSYSMVIFFILTFMVCEATAGLGVLVAFSREQGSDAPQI